MGQYYTAVLRRIGHDGKLEEKFLWPHQYKNGCTLMEFSYLGNYFMNAVCNKLYNEPWHVIFLGDYTQEGMDLKMGENKIRALLRREDKAYNKWSEETGGVDWGTPAEEINFPSEGRTALVNLTKGEYIDLEEYSKRAPFARSDLPDWEAKFHPLSLLTASSNGQGGGDYFPKDDYGLENVGRWCNDKIVIVEYTPLLDILFVKVEYYFKKN